MELSSLLPRLATNKAAILTYDGGKAVRRPHASLFEDASRAQADLVRWGIKPGMRVGIYAANCYGWIVYDLALQSLRAISVPFTDDFKGAINRDLLDRYDISLLLLSKSQAGLFPDHPAYVAYVDSDNGQVTPIQRPHLVIDPDLDELTLVFSSGSAGGLKGLAISRKGTEANLLPVIDALALTGKDRWLVFLPLSNFQQRSMVYAALWYDFDIIITDYSRLFFALKELHPTILVAPPMFYELIETRFHNSGSGRGALARILEPFMPYIPSQTLRLALARKLFPEFHSTFGDRMRLLITGMAPVRPSATKLFARMQLPLAESYGLVEAGSLTFRDPASASHGSVGKLLEGTQVRFAEDGEIIVRRPHNLTLRYFQCADGENERTFLANGEVATGDIGRMDANGNLILLGRKKELIITSGGLKIHPEVIEAELDNCPEIAKAVVFSRNGAPTLVAIIRLREPELLESRAKAEHFIQQMNGGRAIAKIGETIFTDIVFSRENEMLRPNLKLDRRRIASHFSI